MLSEWLIDSRTNKWLTNWLTCQMTGLLCTDWLSYWVCDWLTCWLTNLISWLTDWLADLLTDLPMNWLADWLNYLLTVWQKDWLTDSSWLIVEWVIDLTGFLTYWNKFSMLRKEINLLPSIIWIKTTDCLWKWLIFHFRSDLSSGCLSRLQQPGFWAHLQYCKCCSFCLVFQCDLIIAFYSGHNCLLVTQDSKLFLSIIDWLNANLR